MLDVVALLPVLPVWAWAVLVASALLVGFAKTAIGGLSLVAVIGLALVLPTRASTGVALLLLLVGDVVAVRLYRHSVDWVLILRLILPVAAGIGVGAVFLSLVDDLVLTRTIGLILLGLVVLGFWRDRLPTQRDGVGQAYGGLAGFTTMVANAGGPPMNLYLLAARYDKLRFLGTTAWLFFAINLTKLPISLGLGVLDGPSLVLAICLAPAVLLGTWLGSIVVRRISQAVFERLVTVFVVIAAGYLLLRP